ncbi:MAG: abortive infection family protein [Prevotellaceae bacterium]|nr:abortive infection family protein [Prevotellaceae bacterium]
MNKITALTRRNIFDVLTNGVKIPALAGEQPLYYNFWGVLTPVTFLNRIYQLNTMRSLDSRCENAEDDIQRHTLLGDYPNEWIFTDDRFPLKEGRDEGLLDFLCEIFNPEVRDEFASWKPIFKKLNELITKDGYEFYISGLISGREVYSWRISKRRFSKLSTDEVKDFLNLFERGEYVLDFYEREYFDKFTTENIGIGLCEFFGPSMSMGKSLSKFTCEWNEDDVVKLLLALYGYYEKNDEYQRDKNNPRLLDTIKKCEIAAKRLKVGVTIVNEKVDDMKKNFSSTYMASQIELMKTMQSENPTEAIGKAKEFIESCCKTILEEDGEDVGSKLKYTQLVDTTLNHLKVTPSSIPDKKPEADSIRGVLGNLKGIAININNLRNRYGSGHGRSASFRGLEERHAKLAVGSAAVLVEFLWTTHERSKK